MHPTALSFVQRALTAEHIAGKDILEVGSYDVNGSVRPYVEALKPRRYLGVDASPGPRVDRVVDCERLTDEVAGLWDVVVSTEMLEHVRDWRTCMQQLAAVVKLGGFLVITTRSPGFPYHPFPEDHWRYTHAQMQAILDVLGLETITLEDDPEPGVFVLATKTEETPDDVWARLRELSVDPVIM